MTRCTANLSSFGGESTQCIFEAEHKNAHRNSETEWGQCESRLPGSSPNAGTFCQLLQNHDGMHEHANERWGDSVDHPAHYNNHPSGIECIQIVEHYNFNIGNTIKYLWRAWHKDALLEDLKKARWYLDKEIRRLESK